MEKKVQKKKSNLRSKKSFLRVASKSSSMFSGNFLEIMGNSSLDEIASAKTNKSIISTHKSYNCPAKKSLPVVTKKVYNHTKEWKNINLFNSEDRNFINSQNFQSALKTSNFRVFKKNYQYSRHQERLLKCNRDIFPTAMSRIPRILKNEKRNSS